MFSKRWLTCAVWLQWSLALAAEPLPNSTVAEEFFYTIAEAPSARVWIAPPTWKVEGDTAAPVATRDGIDLCAARGEYEPIQIVSYDTAAGDRQLTLDPAWSGPSENAIEAALHDVLFTGGGPCTTGLTDRLVPVSFGANRAVCTSHNQVFWLTVHISDTAEPGIYTNTVTLALPSFTTSFPIRVTVFNFALPAEPSFTLMANHAFSNSAETNLHTIKRWYADHRMTVANGTYPSGFQPTITWLDCTNFYDEDDQPAQYSIRALADKYIAGNGFNDGVGLSRFIALRPNDSVNPRPSTFCGNSIIGDPRGDGYGTTAYNDAWGAYLAGLQTYLDPAVAPENGGNPFGHDYLAKALYFVMNEPQNTADYNLAAWLAGLSRQYAPTLPLMISEEAKPEIFANTNYPGNGYDVWLGHPPAYSVAVGHALDRRAANGEQSWWYMLPNEPRHFIYPTHPSRPAIETRMLTWLGWHHRVEGWYDELFDAPWMFVNSVTGGVEITTTVRAELLREAAEDHAYFMLANGNAAAQPGIANPADSFVTPLTASLTGFQRDPAKLHWQRKQLGAYLSGSPYEPELPWDGVRPYGSYYFNFQDPESQPLQDPVEEYGVEWEKVGWEDYHAATRIGWFGPESVASPTFAYAFDNVTPDRNDLERSYLYDDFARRATFALGIEDGVYDVAVCMGRPNGGSEALVTVNGKDLFGDRAANEPEILSGQMTRTNRIAVRGGMIAVDFGRQVGGDYWFACHLAVVAVAPSSPDGLDDLWQLEQFGSTTGEGFLAGDDADGDGDDNRTEYCFGSNPTDSNSVARLTSSIDPIGPAFTITWPAATNRGYALQHTVDTIAWSTAPVTLHPTGPVTTTTIPVSEESTMDLFRIAPACP